MGLALYFARIDVNSNFRKDNYMKKETWLKKYIEKNYVNALKFEIEDDTARIELEDKIVRLFIDDNNKITEKERKRRGKKETDKKETKSASNKPEVKAVKSATKTKEKTTNTKNKDDAAKPKKTVEKVAEPTKVNKRNAKNNDESSLKQHLSCRFLPGDSVRLKYDPERKYTVDEVSVTRSGIVYKVSENKYNQTTVCDRDLEKV